MERIKEKYDVVLIYPSENINAFYYMIPLGLASIAAVLRDNGISIKALDLNFYKGDLYNDLKKWNPKLIGIGGTTGTRKRSFKIALQCKSALPTIPVVYGGIHATFTAEDTLRNIPAIDYIIKGEGEFSFLKLFNSISNRSEIQISEISGISFREEEKIIHNKAKRIDNIDLLPIPARDIFDGKYRIKLDYLGLEADFIVTSRGCPFSCNFCAASRMFPGGVRYRTMPNIKKEIDYILSNEKIQAIKLFDSTFTASKEHVLAFCELISEYELFWECEIRVDTVDFELLKIMRDAGCRYVDIGFETTNKKILSSIFKTITVNQVEDVLSWCRELDIKTKVFFTFGHLGQEYENCLEDVDYIKDNKKSISFFATTVGLRIYPGTQLEIQAKEAGLIPLDFSWANYKPNPLRYLLFEFEDQLILIQKKLGYFDLSKIIWKLVINGTVGSSNFILELLAINLNKLIKLIPYLLRKPLYKFRRFNNI